MTVSASELLRSVGVSEEAQGPFGDGPLFRLRFGAIELEAVECMNRRFQQTFHIGGVISTGRTITEVDTEIPAEFESRDEGLAWLAETLRQYVPEACKPAWLLEGEALRHLLPWEQERREYEARPQCTVERAWFRLASKELRQHGSSATPAADAHFSFDGDILKIVLPGHKVSFAMAAQGVAWPEDATVRVSSLQWLPKRLASDPVQLAIWRGHLVVAGTHLPLVGITNEDAQ